MIVADFRDTTYYVNSHQIEFKELRNFGKEGPICGQLYIDNQKINCPEKCDGFGGPVLITSKRIYIPVYQKKNMFNGYLGRISCRN